MSQDQKDFNAPSNVGPGRIQYAATAKIDNPSYAMMFAMCQRCGKGRQVDDSGHCRDCRTVVVPDPAREAAIGRRIHQMRRIHELEREMTDIERQEWIAHGFWILRKDGNALVGILGDR